MQQVEINDNSGQIQHIPHGWETPQCNNSGDTVWVGCRSLRVDLLTIEDKLEYCNTKCHDLNSEMEDGETNYAYVSFDSEEENCYCSRNDNIEITNLTPDECTNEESKVYRVSFPDACAPGSILLDGAEI
eukprot:UN34909